MRVRRPPQAGAAGLAGAGATPIAIPAAAPALVEDRGAVERTLAGRSDYLQDIVSRMPRDPKHSVEVAVVADDVAAAMIRYALHEQDVVQRVTHGETGMIHGLFGDVAQEVVRSGAVPVLLVHPNTTRRAAKE